MFKKVLLTSILLYMLAGFYLLPYLLKKESISLFKDRYAIDLKIKDISFNPFNFQLNINNLNLIQDAKTLISCDGLSIELKPSMLLDKTIYIKEIYLNKAYLFAKIKDDGTLNFDIFKSDNKKTKESSSSKAMRVVLDILRLRDGVIEFEDSAKNYKTSINEIDIKLSDIDTKKLKYDSAKARITFNFEDGGSFELKNNIKEYEPLKLDGEFALNKFRAYSAYRYIQELLKVELTSGLISLDGKYTIDTSNLNDINMQNINLIVDNLRLKPKDKSGDILALKKLELKDVNVSIPKSTIDIKSASLDRLNISAIKESGGIDMAKYLIMDGNKSSENQENRSATWSITLADTKISNMSATLEDKDITPNKKTKLNELNLTLQDISFPKNNTLNYDLNFLVDDTFKCSLGGVADYKDIKTDSNIKCNGLDVVRYTPYIDKLAKEYLKSYNIDLKSATIDFSLNADVKLQNESVDAKISNANISVNNFILSNKKEDFLSFKRFGIDGINIDTASSSINAKDVNLDKLRLAITKNNQSKLNITSLVEFKESTNKTKKDSTPYTIKLDKFGLNGSEVSFNDSSFGDVVKVLASNINLNAKNISSLKNSKLDYDFSCNINNSAKIYSKATLKHTPLEIDAKLGIKRVPLKELNPYLSKATYLKLSDGLLNLESKLEYKNDQIKANGNLWFDSFYIQDIRDDSVIASLSKVNLKSFDFTTLTNSLDIKEIVLDSFYLDAQIAKDKSFNLAKLIKKQDESTIEQNSTKSSNFNYNISKVDISNGYINFADYSLPIKFKTLMHNLNGTVGTISSKPDETTSIEIDGAVDEYGETSIKGELKSSDIKSYTDINLDFKNLDLGAMSGYSAEFAGYTIDEGRLFLGLNYKIENSKLISQNNLTIKNITLGKEIEDENITSLPLPLAVLLLEDNNKIIDINLPIEGDIDSPEFKYTSLIFKAFVNLISKAITSPFKLLAGAIGLGEDENLEAIGFEAGSYALLPQQKEILDKLAQAMQKRDKLGIIIDGGYDKTVDSEAIKVRKLKQKVLEQTTNRRSSINILEDIFVDANSKFELDKLQQEVKKGIKSTSNYDVAYQKELTKRCAALEVVTDIDILDLANHRASTIQTYFVEKKEISQNRVKIATSVENIAPDKGLIKTKFRLNTN